MKHVSITSTICVILALFAGNLSAQTADTSRSKEGSGTVILQVRSQESTEGASWEDVSKEDMESELSEDETAVPQETVADSEAYLYEENSDPRVESQADLSTVRTPTRRESQSPQTTKTTTTPKSSSTQTTANTSSTNKTQSQSAASSGTTPKTTTQTAPKTQQTGSESSGTTNTGNASSAAPAGTATETNAAQDEKTEASAVQAETTPQAEAPSKDNLPEYLEIPETEDLNPPVNPLDANPDAENTAANEEPLETYEEEDLQLPSRTIKLQKNQYLDITYPGNGWIYLGETDNTTLMRYFGRKLDSSDTEFTLRAKDEGSTLLHFYKIDPLNGEAVNDYLEITVSGTSNESDSHVKAPSYAEAVPENQRPKKNSSAQAAAESTKSAPMEENPAESASRKSPQSAETSKAQSQQAQSAAPKTSSQSSTQSSSAGNTSSSSSSAATQRSTERTQSSSSSRASRRNSSSQNSQPASSTQSSSTSTQAGTNSQAAQSTASNSRTTSPAAAQSSKTASSSDAKQTQAANIPKAAAPITSQADDDLLKKAQAAYDSKDYAGCLDILTDFFNTAVSRLDEGLYLQGQCLEASSPSRNIKASLDSYETLVKRYPQSSKWQDANDRIIYIRRFYFTIR